MKLIMKNYETKAFGEFLYELALKGKDSRMRSRFITLLEEQVLLISKEREILMADYSQKDEDGQAVVSLDDEGREYIVLEDKTAFNIELSKLMSEEFIIDVEGKEEMVKTIQEIILNVDKEFSGVEAQRYNRFCDIVETVKFD